MPLFDAETADPKRRHCLSATMPQRPPRLQLPSPITPTASTARASTASSAPQSTVSCRSTPPPPTNKTTCGNSSGGHLDAAFRAFDGLVSLA